MAEDKSDQPYISNSGSVLCKCCVWYSCYNMLLSSHIYAMYVSVFACNVAASKCHPTLVKCCNAAAAAAICDWICQNPPHMHTMAKNVFHRQSIGLLIS